MQTIEDPRPRLKNALFMLFHALSGCAVYIRESNTFDFTHSQVTRWQYLKIAVNLLDE